MPQRIMGLIYIAISLFLALVIPMFVVVYHDLLEGARLPALTDFMIKSNPFLWLICGCAPGVFLILSNNPVLNNLWVRIGFALFLVILVGIAVVALLMPLTMSFSALGA